MYSWRGYFFHKSILCKQLCPSINNNQVYLLSEAELFENLRIYLENMSVTVNLYLVIQEARRAYLYARSDRRNELTKKVLDVASQHELSVLELPGSLLISKEPISYDQVKDITGMAEILGYCVDPGFGIVKPGSPGRTAYLIDLIMSSLKIRITQFVCSEGYYPTEDFLEETRERFQKAIDKVNSEWEVRITRRAA